jgi:hypothetical protein
MHLRQILQMALTLFLSSSLPLGITPGGHVWLPHQGRPLLGCEKLLIQGIPYFRLALGIETEVQLGDLAGNAMSLTVVCAAMLAAIVAPQLRADMIASLDKTGSPVRREVGENHNILEYFSPKKSAEDNTMESPQQIKAHAAKYYTADVATITTYLKSKSSGHGTSTNRQRQQWAGEIPVDSISFSNAVVAERSDDDQNSLRFLTELSKLAEDAEKCSVWCTCETSGSNSRTKMFLQCKVCRASCCRNCISTTSGYNTESHDTFEVEIGEGTSADCPDDIRHIGTFQTKIRSIVPPSLYFTKEAIDAIAEVANDRYRIRGLEKFNFGLHRIKRDRRKWLVIYYARENNGLGEAVAEIRISVGQTKRSEHSSLGVLCELTSFMPARTEPLEFGKLASCCKIYVPYQKRTSANASSPAWEIKMPKTRAKIQLSGQGTTPSHRVEVGLTDLAASALEEHTQKKSSMNAFEAAKERGEERRWIYPSNWKDWPESIRIRCFDETVDDRIIGIYKRAKCRQTTNHSALWIKSSGDQSTSVYILLKPNVNRTGPDRGIISTSMDHDDSTCILAELDTFWEPCDSLSAGHQRQGVECSSWQAAPSVKCLVPASRIRVESVDKNNSLVVVSGLRDTDVAMLCRSATGAEAGPADESLLKLNVHSGQQAQQIVRVINSAVVAPILKHAAMGKLKHDLSPHAAWKVLEAKKNEPFGSCQKTIPIRPTELWYFDEERKAWERSSEPGASRKYYQELQEAPRAFEFFLDKKRATLDVRCFPMVVAHHAASQLLFGRHIEPDDDKVTVSVRLSDISQQSDPVIDRFKVINCSSLRKTFVDLRKPHKLYDRQQKVVTKMLAIENQNTKFTELEMSEFEMPISTGISVMAKAVRSVSICGGVIADAIGAGKTVISIAIILKGIERARASRAAPQKSGATLVVVPPGLIDQWKAEVNKFTTDLSVLQVYDFQALQKTTCQQIVDADVVIVPIDILQSEGYLENLVKKAGLDEHLKNLPQLPQYTGQQEQNAARGVWIPHTSTDPYAGANNPNNQKRRNQSAYYTHVYQKAIDKIRKKDFPATTKGVPLEFFQYERIFCDEIHEVNSFVWFLASF